MTVVSVPAMATPTTVIQVSGDGMRFLVQQDPSVPLQVGDPLCAMRTQKRLACGVVISQNEFGAWIGVRMTTSETVVPGDKAALVLESSQVQGMADNDELWVSHPLNQPWSDLDRVCIISASKCVAWGNVVEVAPLQARVKVDRLESGVRLGDYVRQVPAAPTSQLLRYREGDEKKVWAPVLGVTPSGRMWVAEPNQGHWEKDDRVCVLNGPATIACGDVIEVQKSASVVQLYPKRTRLPQVGDVAEKRPPAKREVASLESSTKTMAGVGMNYTFPVLHVDHAIDEHLTLGLMPTFLNFSAGGGNLSGSGALATLTYHPTKLFEGFWFQMGVGAYSLDVERLGQTQSQTSLAFLLSGGWRWKFNGFSLATGLGVNHFFTSQYEDVGLNFSGLKPAILLQLSFPIDFLL